MSAEQRRLSIPGRRSSDADQVWWPPSWLTITVVLALGLIGVAAAAIWYEVADGRRDQRDECQQAIEFRHDLRTMWLELFEAFPDAADETGLLDDLEALLPPLRCDDADPVPDLGGTP